jgi:phosphoglycerate dehydrogenase-like enzyme
MRRILYFLEDRIPQPLRQLVTSYLELAGYNFEQCFYSESPEIIRKRLKWCEAVLFAPGRYLSMEMMEDAAHVCLMQLWSSGYDKFNLVGARTVGIPVANNGGANAISVAEHTILLMLAAARRLPECHIRATRGMWAGNSHGMDMVMLYGKTLSIIGLGNIGKEVARRARAFGMRVLYNDIKRMNATDEFELGVEFGTLDELLMQSDFLTLHLHLNTTTLGLIDERALSLLKHGCIIVNVSRSQLVNLPALMPMLRDGRVLAAGFDVFETEPTSGYEAYLSLPNVVATPHTAGSTLDTYHMAMRNCIKNLDRALSGEKPLWIVN